VDENFHRPDSPELDIPETVGPSGKDPVTVTLTFRSGNDKNIEEALRTISGIIGDSIVDFTMVPDARKKDPAKGNRLNR